MLAMNMFFWSGWSAPIAAVINWVSRHHRHINKR